MRNIDFNYVVIRNGADFGKIWPAQNSSPSVKMNADGDIKTSLSGNFLSTVFDFEDKPTEETVNWLSDMIRPEMVIDGAVYPLGVFIPVTVQIQEDVEGAGFTSLHIDAYDRCWQIKDIYTEQSQYFASGTNYIDAIVSLLTAAGIAIISATETDAELAEAREDWNIGTSYLEIINQLLSEINYNPIWFNETGAAVLEPASVPTANNLDHMLDATDPENIILPGVVRETDIYSAPNVFICVCSNPDKSGAMIAKSENTNPQSILSIPRRGRRIAKVFQVDNIADQDELQAYADRLRNESMITGENITVSTGLLPGYGVSDVVGIRYGDLFDICVEKSWTMDLRVGGTMRHLLEKVVINLG